MPEQPPPAPAALVGDLPASNAAARSKTWWRVLAAVAGLALLMWIGRHLGRHVPYLELWVEQQGAWGPVVFVALFLVAAVFMSPADVFSLMAGALFGVYRGFCIMLLGETLGALLLFFIARYLARPRVERFLDRHPKFRAIDRAAGPHSLKIQILLRLAPIPFAPLSYALGVSAVSARSYIFSLIGLIPGVFVAVYYGFVAKRLTQIADAQQPSRLEHDLILLGGVLVTLALVAILSHLALKELKAAAAEDDVSLPTGKV